MVDSESPTVPFLDLPARMKLARERLGVFQSEMGELIGVHQRTVANYEGGKTEPKLAVLRAWAAECNVPLDWLAFGIDPCPSCGGRQPQ